MERLYVDTQKAGCWLPEEVIAKTASDFKMWATLGMYMCVGNVKNVKEGKKEG